MTPIAFSPSWVGSRSPRFLFLGAHPDDIEIGCGATVISLIQSLPQPEVFWVVFSAPGERKEEALDAAAAFLGPEVSATFEVLGFRDGFFPYQGGAIKEQFEDIKTRFDPDVIFTHREADKHQDHRLVSELTWNTFRNHLILEYEVPKYDGDLGNPNVFVPVGEGARKRKLALLQERFPTQRSKPWFSEETFSGLLRIRGIECGSPTGYAEGFHARKLILDLGE